MRHYMKAVGSPAYLDEMLKQTMANRYQENYSSFEAFQQLINDVYESDQRENMVDLFQSSLIKKVFIEPPGKNSNVKIDIRFESSGVTVCFVGVSPYVENKCTIGKANLAGTVTHQYNTAAFSPNQAAASAERNVVPDRMALAARHPVPRITIDASVSMDCTSLSLELAPSILVLGRSLTTVLAPNKPESDSSSPLRPPLTSPVTWQTPIPPSKSVDIRNSNLAISEWKMVSTPELGKLRPTAHTKIRIREHGLDRSGGNDKVPVQEGRSKDKVKSKMRITLQAIASVDEINLKGSSQKSGGAQVVIRKTCFLFQLMDPEATIHEPQQLEHSAILRLSTVSLFFFNPSARAKEEQTLGKIHITDLVLHEVSSIGNNRRIIRTFSSTSSSSSSKAPSAGNIKREWEHRGVTRAKIHDVLLHFSSAKLPFNTYDKMLPKLLGFFDEWNPVDLIPSQLSANVVANEKDEGLIPSSVMGLRLKLDLQNVTLDTDVLHSLPFKYTIQRLTANITPDSKMMANGDAAISKDISFDLRIWGHELQVEKLTGSTPSFLSSKLVFPQITSHGTISEMNPKPGTPRTTELTTRTHNLALTCGLEIDVIKHTIDVDMLNTIMVLQKTIETELKQAVQVFSGFAKKRKDKQPGVPKSSTTLPNIQLTYLFDLALRGIEIRALSPLSILLLSSDLIDCKLKGSYLFAPAPPPATPTKIPSGVSSASNEPTPASTTSALVLDWQVRLRKLSMCLTDAPGQVWASIVTNIEVRTSPETLESSASFELLKPSSRSPMKHAIPWFGVGVRSTSITLHAGAIECAAGLFVHYLDSFEKGKNTIKDALGPASPKAQPKEIAFLIRVVDTTLSVPLAIAPSSDSSNAPNSAIDPNLVAALESFVLSGEVTNVASPSKAPAASPPQRLLGSSHFSALQLRFRDGKSSTATNREAYSDNWAMISQGTCAIAGHLDGPSVVLAGELVTSGMQANVTNEILKYSNLLHSFVALSQEKLKNLNSTVPQQPPVAPSAPTPRTLELDFAFNIQAGLCRLSRAWTHGNPQPLNLDPSAVVVPPIASKPSSKLPGSGPKGSPFHSPAPPRASLPSNESFPLPPLVVSIHHTFTLAEGKGTEDSSVGITIDSAKLRFTPFLAIFIEEMMYCSSLFPAPIYVPTRVPSTPTTPAQPPTSSGRGSVTVAIKFNPTTLMLEGGGVTEIVCTLELGPVEFFLSSLHKAVPPHGNTVLLHNAVANIHSLALKIHHPMSADENAGLFVSNIGFNIGQAYP